MARNHSRHTATLSADCGIVEDISIIDRIVLHSAQFELRGVVESGELRVEKWGVLYGLDSLSVISVYSTAWRSSSSRDAKTGRADTVWKFFSQSHNLR